MEHNHHGSPQQLLLEETRCYAAVCQEPEPYLPCAKPKRCGCRGKAWAHRQQPAHSQALHNHTHVAHSAPPRWLARKDTMGDNIHPPAVPPHPANSARLFGKQLRQATCSTTHGGAPGSDQGGALSGHMLCLCPALRSTRVHTSLRVGGQNQGVACTPHLPPPL
jgi:hypothetical protein